MSPQRWQQVRELFEDALEHPSAGRPAFLLEACGADAELHREVESMFAACDTAGDFLEAPPRQLAADVFEAKQVAQPALPALNAGQELDHYEIISLLGKGGMGEVYLARDQRLHRKVALKVLPASYTYDRARVRRFEQEVHAASALNHPNIAMIFDIGQAECGHFIAMELVEGQTLRARLESEKLRLSAVLEIVAQIVSALAAAHQAGVVHRDIKPENIMLRPDGYVKVLDFGLAKLTEARRTDELSGLTRSTGTAPGTVMGTISYMSPEQVRGQEVDARSDLFSLGVVLHEMISGETPFRGVTPSDVMATILRDAPPALGATASPELQQIVTQALEKNLDTRYQTAGELLRDLQYSLEWKAERGATAVQPSPISDTGKSAAGRTPSSAEYVVNEIKRHKLAACAELIVLALIAAFISWRDFGQPGIPLTRSPCCLSSMPAPIRTANISPTDWPTA